MERITIEIDRTDERFWFVKMNDGQARLTTAAMCAVVARAIRQGVSAHWLLGDQRS